MTKYTQILSIVILLIVVFLVNPTHILMPESMNTLAVLGLVVAFLIFVSLIWKEKPKDEREELHIQIAGRVSFITGTAIIVFGIVTQALAHSVDPWLFFALSGMVLAKLLARLYNSYKN